MKRSFLLEALVAFTVIGGTPSLIYAAPQTAEADQGELGFLTVREEGVNVQASKEAYDLSGESIGILNLSPTQIQKIKDTAAHDKPSDAAQKILSELQSCEEAHKKGDWTTAERAMRAIYTRHPDLPVFGKWVAIYQNRNKEYKESLATISSLKESFPLDKSIQNSFLFDYYILDDVRGMKDYQTADAMLKLMKQKMAGMGSKKVPDGTLAAAMNNKDFMQILLDYQELMLHNDMTGEVKKSTLDALWARIPKNKQRTLDHYAGFDLSELGYIYGVTYARKDVLNAYVKQKEYSYDKETINKIRTAKKIVYDET